MINVVVRVGFAVIVFIFGLMLWVSGDMANALSIHGFGRFFGGLIAMGVGALIAFLKGD